LKRLKEGEVLLNKNVVKSDKPELNDGIRSIIKQKPNRRILGVFRFHLGVYTLADRENDSSDFRNWVKNTIGEKPVLLDTFLTKKSTGQIRQFMINSGYFNAVVTDTTIYKKNRKKANVYYLIEANQPYYVVSYRVQTIDPVIEDLVLKDSANWLIRPGMIFDANIIQKERDRVTTMLKNQGYYFFNQAYIRFTADSSLSNRRVALKMYISSINEDNDDTTGMTTTSRHLAYRINNIYIQTDFNPLSTVPNNPLDTTIYKDYFFVKHTTSQRFNTETIRHHLLIKKGDPYTLRNLENSYKLLGNLNVFKFINIKFETVKNDSIGAEPLLNCFIYLTPSPRQEHREEIEGTYNGGALGVAGNIAYRNKNFLRGAELLEIKLKGSLESIKDFSDPDQSHNKFPFFNTYEIGPEINLSFPKLIVPKGIVPKKLRSETPYSNEYTTLTANYDLQERPEFKRTIANFAIQWYFNETETKSHLITPAEINFVNVDLNSAFETQLKELNDPYLFYTYADHLITFGRWSYIINTQKLKRLRNYYFFMLNVETAGNTLWLANHLLSSKPQEDKSYTVLKARYSQYFRPDVDFRFYQVINENNTMVYRATAGLGIPYLNAFALPFEKAFFAGGANDLRAFRARTVGPGSYYNVQNIEQTGEIKLNCNFEFRFDIFKILQGAAFVDAGNIWLTRDDPNRPGGLIEADRFLSEFAIGGGLGARLNFTFFIIRMDAGVPFKNPSFPKEDRWVIKDPQLKTITFNLGIGYPF